MAMLGEFWVEFDRIRIKHPRLKDAHNLFDDLRAAKRGAPHRPQRHGIILAESHAGKSTAVVSYIETKVVDDAIERKLFSNDLNRTIIAEQQRIVVYVTLSSPASPKTLAGDILVALGDPHANKGTANALLQRAYDYLRFYNTELLVIDEINHLSTKDIDLKTAEAAEKKQIITNTLKTMLQRGLVPIVFVGIPEARRYLQFDDQVKNRKAFDLDFSALSLEDPAESKIFIEYCGVLGLKLQQHGIFSKTTDLVSGDVPACLFEISKGLIGIVSNFIRSACEIAIRENASHLTRDHLERATDDWAIPEDLIDYNPFTHGIRVGQILTATK